MNIRNFKNLFRPPLSVTFIKCLIQFVIRTLSAIENFDVKVLPSNSGYKFLHTLFSFSLRLASFGVIFIGERLHYCTDLQVSQVRQQILLHY